MFESVKSFKPVKGYEEEVENRRYFQYRQNFEYPSAVFAYIIYFDYLLRQSVQKEERFDVVYRAMKILMCNDHDMNDILDGEMAIKEIKKQTDWVRRKLYSLEWSLPQRPLKKVYDKIRQNPTWYLHPDLVKDCIGVGGCCSRGCGCCKKRYENSAKGYGIGHCTSQCKCCEIHRGFGFTSEEHDEIYQSLQQALSSPNPAYLLTITEAFFSMPGTFGPKSWYITMAAKRKLKRLKSAFRIAKSLIEECLPIKLASKNEK